jgi:hypothetical protein
MRLRSRRDQSVPESLWHRIDRVAGKINPFLMVLAIGLIILNLTCLGSLLVKLPITRIDPAACALPPQVAGNMAAGSM